MKEELSSVWVVTEGNYSNYRIVAIFGTEDEAKAFMNGAQLPGATESWGSVPSSVGCEEFILGIPPDGWYQPTWTVFLTRASGKLLDHKPWQPTVNFEQHPRDWSQGNDTGTVDGLLIMGRSTVSKEHAIKVAIEARQAYLREKALTGARK